MNIICGEVNICEICGEEIKEGEKSFRLAVLEDGNHVRWKVHCVFCERKIVMAYNDAFILPCNQRIDDEPCKKCRVYNCFLNRYAKEKKVR